MVFVLRQQVLIQIFEFRVHIALIFIVACPLAIFKSTYIPAFDFTRSISNTQINRIITHINQPIYAGLHVQQQNAIWCSMFIDNVQKFFLHLWHRLAIILRHVEKSIDLIFTDRIYTFHAKCFITNTNNNSSAFSICKAGNQRSQIRGLNLCRFTIKIFIFRLRHHI